MNKDMKTSKLSVGTAAKFLIPALCLSTALTAAGATYTWDGGGTPGSGANWNTLSSWAVAGVDPVAQIGSGDNARFEVAGGNNVVTVNVNTTIQGFDLVASTTVSTTLNADNVGSGGTRTISAGSGNGSFRHSVTLNGVILNKTSGSTFNLTANMGTLTLNNGAQWNISGGEGNFHTTSARTITASAGAGSITVASGAKLHVGTGDQTITIQSPVSFTSAGLLNMNRGTLNLQGTSALSGTVDFAGPTPGTAATLRNSGALTATGLTVLKSSSQATFTPLWENTGGTLTFAGALDLNVPLSVTGGTVQGVTTSATSSTGTGNVSISGGTVSPAGAGVGTLRVPDALNFSGGTYSVSIASGGGYDQLIAGGAVTLGSPSLSVASDDVTDGTVFTILSGSGLTGTFAGLLDGATVNGGSQNYTINYTGTGVNLTAVPEPQFIAGAVGLGLLGFTVWRRCQKRA